MRREVDDYEKTNPRERGARIREDRLRCRSALSQYCLRARAVHRSGRAPAPPIASVATTCAGRRPVCSPPIDLGLCLFTILVITRTRFFIAVPRPLLLASFVVVVATQFLVAAAVASNGGYFPNPLKKREHRGLPPVALASALRSVWASRTNASLRYVVIDYPRIGGLLVQQFQGRIRVLDGHLDVAGRMAADGDADAGYLVLLEAVPRNDDWTRMPQGLQPASAGADASGTIQIAGEIDEGIAANYYWFMKYPSDSGRQPPTVIQQSL